MRGGIWALLFWSNLLILVYSECAYMPYFRCNICYELVGDTFTYSSCRQKYCAEYENDYNSYRRLQQDGDETLAVAASYSSSRSYRKSRRNRQRRCVRYSHYNYGEEECLASCCGEAGVSEEEFTYQLVNQCRKENQRLAQQLALIIGCVVGGVFLIMGSVLFYKWRKDHT